MAIIKNLDKFAHATLVQSNKGNYFVVSSVNGLANETYIFPADENGEVTSWGEVWGIRPQDHEAGIAAAETEDD